MRGNLETGGNLGSLITCGVLPRLSQSLLELTCFECFEAQVLNCQVRSWWWHLKGRYVSTVRLFFFFITVAFVSGVKLMLYRELNRGFGIGVGREEAFAAILVLLRASLCCFRVAFGHTHQTSTPQYKFYNHGVFSGVV